MHPNPKKLQLLCHPDSSLSIPVQTLTLLSAPVALNLLIHTIFSLVPLRRRRREHCSNLLEGHRLKNLSSHMLSVFFFH